MICGLVSLTLAGIASQEPMSGFLAQSLQATLRTLSLCPSNLIFLKQSLFDLVRRDCLFSQLFSLHTPMNHKLIPLSILTLVTILAQGDFASGQTYETQNSQDSTQLLSETPPCFMITSDGRMTDLSSLCHSPSSNTNTPRANAQPAQEPQVSPSSASENPQEPAEDPQADPVFAPYDADTQGVG
jgi:hypothetical protein